MSTCRSCGAEIRWVRWADSRKLMPLDVAPVADGNVALIDGHALGDPLVRTAKDGDAVRFKSHFATCPESKEWRKR